MLLSKNLYYFLDKKRRDFLCLLVDAEKSNISIILLQSVEDINVATIAFVFIS